MTGNILILCAAGMLVTAYLMVGQKALFTTIRLYGLQSVLLGIVAATSAISAGRNDLFVTAALTVTLKGVLIPWFLMVTRKKAITQILALLTVENAVFLVAVGVTSGMPLIVELGISFDVILAVLVLGVLVQRIVGRFESMDVSRLSKLKG